MLHQNPRDLDGVDHGATVTVVGQIMATDQGGIQNAPHLGVRADPHQQGQIAFHHQTVDPPPRKELAIILDDLQQVGLPEGASEGPIDRHVGALAQPHKRQALGNLRETGAGQHTGVKGDRQDSRPALLQHLGIGVQSTLDVTMAAPRQGVCGTQIGGRGIKHQEIPHWPG